jgi:GDP-L-fucose synthase
MVWGTGQARREFLYVDDLADACIHLMQCYSDVQHVNIGTGEDVTIEELAGLIAHVVGYEGTIAFDKSRPDGAPRKLLDVSRLAAMGWRPSISLKKGLALTYQSFLASAQTASVRDATA